MDFGEARLGALLELLFDSVSSRLILVAFKRSGEGGADLFEQLFNISLQCYPRAGLKRKSFRVRGVVEVVDVAEVLGDGAPTGLGLEGVFYQELFARTGRP